MKKYFLILLAGIVLGFTACNDYLELSPTDKVTSDGIFTDVTTAEYAVNYFYTYLYNIHANQSELGITDGLTDQLKYNSYGLMPLELYASWMAYGGEHLTSNFVTEYLGYWSTRYKQVRRINEVLYSLKNYGTLSAADAERLEAELRFFRAYVYFDLVKRYKNIVLYDEDITAISTNRPLATEAEAWTMIKNDLEFAETHLPTPANAKNRLHKYQVYAFATRALLYNEDWEGVKAAADTVIANGGYSLVPKYAECCIKSITEGNKEAIIQATFNPAIEFTHSFDEYYTPRGDFLGVGLPSGGGYASPTQEMVESFELADGSGFPDWSAWHNTETPTTSTPPYADLEPRFHANILYNGAAWKGRKIETFVDGTDGFAEWGPGNASSEMLSTTSYFIGPKLVDESHDVEKQKYSKQPVTILRYAEVLLNAAEAEYRLGNIIEAQGYVNQIRARVNLPGTAATGDKLFTAIRQERKVEFAFEGLWWWDQRRWGLGAEDYTRTAGLNNYQVHGLKIEKNGANFTYLYVLADDEKRTFNATKLNRFPIPLDELSNNNQITQFEEWQ